MASVQTPVEVNLAEVKYEQETGYPPQEIWAFSLISVIGLRPITCESVMYVPDQMITYG